MTEANQRNFNVTIFFCSQLDPGEDATRRLLEKQLGPRIKFFPLPCSGRIESLHLLKALEAGAHKVYLIVCPEGACRYGEGNIRARKRFEYARQLIREIGLPEDCLEMVVAPGPLPLSIDQLVRRLLELPPAAALDCGPGKWDQSASDRQFAEKGVRL
jgi:coenzyme F420-reducing hydrogenase delta subunit